MESSFLDVLEYENMDPDEPHVLNKYVLCYVSVYCLHSHSVRSADDNIVFVTL